MKNAHRFIMLVDDSQEDVELALTAFKQANIANPISILRDGAEAMDFLLLKGAYTERKTGNPLVILMDVKMPRMNGIEALAKIRSISTLKTIPVVTLTSSEQPTDLLKSYDIGANAYVIKPVEFDDFIKAIQSITLYWTLTNEPPSNE